MSFTFRITLVSAAIFTSSLYAQSMKLKDVLFAALQNNPALKTAIFNPQIAETDILTAKIRPNPRLNTQILQLVDPPYWASNVPWNSNRNRQDWWQLTKVIQWPGVRKWKIRTAQQQQMMTVHDYSITEKEILLEVAQKYLDLWTNLKQLVILNDAKSNIDSLITVNRPRVQKKELPETDFLRTEILSEECAIQISETYLDVKNDLRYLQLLTGLTDSIQIDTSLHILGLNFNIDSLITEAGVYRPDILLSESKIAYSNANIKLQKHLAFPTVDFGLLWNPQNTVLYVGFIATIDLPIFDRNQGEIKKSYILTRQFEQNLNSVKLRVNTEVITAYNEFNNRRNNVIKYRVIFSKTEQILDEIRDNYGKGETDIIDFLEAQRSWIEVKNYYVELQSKYYKSYVNLIYSTGRMQQLLMD
jgi:cobalt-zinc-cadmium efflux system outer membrane protein